MVTKLTYRQEQLLELVRNHSHKLLRDSRYKDAVESTPLSLLGGDYEGTIAIPLQLSNGICMYFWQWYCAKEHVRKFSALAKYEHGYMTHNPMYNRNVRNCILQRNALRKLPVLRKLHKLFIKEVKALGNINAVVLKYADTSSMLDDHLQRWISEVNVSRGKRFSENTGPSLKWQRAKDRREAKMSDDTNVMAFSFG